MGRRIYFSIFMLIAIAVGSQSAQAAYSCHQVHTRSRPDQISIASQFKSNEGLIPATQASIEKLVHLEQRFNLPFISRNPVVALETAFSKLQKETVPANSMEKANDMAKFGKEIMDLLPETTEARRKQVEYVVIEAVSKLESFQPSEMVDKENVVFEQHKSFNYFPMSKFNRVAKSYVNKGKAYESLRSHTGIIDWSDIRDIFSSNQWIVEIKNHDTYHLHYSMGHPYYLPTVFRTAWSRNSLRYFLVSSLFEGIDTFQTAEESTIFNYMKNRPEYMSEGKFDLEAAIMYLGRAPMAEIQKIAAETGLQNSYTYRQFIKWRPKRHAKLSEESVRDEQINAYIQETRELVSNPENEKYYIYTHRSLQLK